MKHQNQTHSFSEFAEELLQVYQSRVAQDWVDGLIFMSTSGGRIDLLTKAQKRAHDFLSLDKPEPDYSGAAIEAIVGEFGSGKSHLGFLMKYHFLSIAENTMVVHCQMTGDRTLGEVFARALRSLWLSGYDSECAAGVEMSAFNRLRQAFHGETRARQAMLAQTMKGYIRKLEPSFADDFATALFSGQAHVISEFLTVWVAKESPLLATEAFEVILGVFARTGVAKRVAFILDEVEALESLDRAGQLAAVQAFQDLHDDFAFRVPGLPTLYWIFLSATNFWNSGIALLPSFFGERDRTRIITTIPDMQRHEIHSLADRYAMLLQLTGKLKNAPTASQIEAAAEAAWAELESAGRKWHMRSVHTSVRDAVTRACSPT